MAQRRLAHWILLATGTIAAGGVFYAVVSWDELVENYHLRELRSDPERRLFELVVQPDGSAKGRAVRRYVESEAGLRISLQILTREAIEGLSGRPGRLAPEHVLYTTATARAAQARIRGPRFTAEGLESPETRAVTVSLSIADESLAASSTTERFADESVHHEFDATSEPFRALFALLVQTADKDLSFELPEFPTLRIDARRIQASPPENVLGSSANPDATIFPTILLVIKRRASIVPTLFGLLSSPDEKTRASAILGLLDYPLDEDGLVRAARALDGTPRAFRYLYRHGRRAFPLLRQATRLKSTTVETRLELVDALTRLRGVAAAEITDLCYDPAPRVRAAALNAYAQLENPPEGSAELLRICLTDPSRLVRVEAIRVFPRVVEVAEFDELAPVLDRLKDEDADVRAEAIVILSSISATRARIAARIAPALSDDEASVRQAALDALIRLDIHARGTRRELEAYAKLAPKKQREMIAELLDRIEELEESENAE